MRVAGWLLSSSLVTMLVLVSCSGSKSNTKDTPKDPAPAQAADAGTPGGADAGTAGGADAGVPAVVDAGPPPPLACDLFAPACAAGQACQATAAGAVCGAPGSAGEAAACAAGSDCAAGLLCVAGTCLRPCNAAHACTSGMVYTVTDASSGLGGCTAAPPVEKKPGAQEPKADEKKKPAKKKGKK